MINKKIKFSIVCYCPCGYFLEESYIPLINNLSEEFNIYFLISDQYLNKRHIFKIKDLKKNGLIKEYFILTSEKISLKFHLFLKKLCKYLSEQNVISYLLMEDFTLVARYLIRSSRPKKSFVIVMSLSSNWPILYKFYKLKDDKIISSNVTHFRREKYKKLVEAYKNKILLRFISINLGNRFFNYLLKVKKKLSHFLNYFLLPVFTLNKPFLRGYLERSRISGDHCDICAVYDEDEYKANSLFIKKPSYLINHPAEYLNIDNKGVKNKILIIFSGCLAKEMSQENINIWSKRIIEFAFCMNVTSCDLRIHPRTSKYLQWPFDIKAELELKGINVSITKDLTISLVDHLSAYKGILGGPSGALFIASLITKDICILGLSNCQDNDLGDEKWILGRSNNIHWLTSSDNISSLVKLKKTKKNSINRISLKKLINYLNRKI